MLFALLFAACGWAFGGARRARQRAVRYPFERVLPDADSYFLRPGEIRRAQTALRL